ncbi:MAG: FAD-dependent oxidoreductase [Thermomicrobiales bacterium]|nr:FAD-dependent oxidoreductase [Thermomicrobiales bacterium]
MTDTIRYERQIPVVDGGDVLVVGGGPAGLAAAIAAARNGARTTLIERYGYLGGNLTAGLVGPCMTSYSLDGQHQLIKGIFEEMVFRLEAAGGALHPSKIPAGSAYCGFIIYGHDKVTPFDPEAVKMVALDMVREAGVSLRLHTMVADTLVAENRVEGVVAVSKSGLQAIRATVTVDCSADGDVAARAGAAFEQGRDEDGLTQPMTLFFRVAKVDDAKVEAYARAHPDDYRPFASLVAQAREAGEFPIPRKGIGLYRTLEPGVYRINTTRLHNLDGTDVEDLTRAEIEGREQIKILLGFFRKWLPGFEQCELYDTAATMGVRETRRIVGEYTLTLDDLATGRDFEDTIAYCGYPVDIHSPTGDGGGADDTHRTANEYQIPFRCLVPRDIDGLLVAGRCVSATHEALGAIRVMPPSFAMGQAAGTAAAMAIEWGIAPRQVPVPQLRELLTRQGVFLGDRETAGATA